ncbi:hypothetical protein GIB67_025498 [Kingdonia uniflora]|uniref:Uncharacterized protein n=1 Tax=Kingdonia uniflora TaxID=39325 RepID=A0A7J7PCI0_9MAGN|nr:hypothetical protein GIB67_025498 [Kingdonia uniflora]
MSKALSASGTTGSGEVVKDKRRRVEPLGDSGEKVVEGKSTSVEDLKEVAHLVKEIWLGIDEEKNELKKLETKANLDEMVEERDRLGRHLMLKGYSEEEVDAIKADTYDEEEDEEEAGVVGIVDDSSRAREDDVLMCNRKFADQFDRMKEASENRKDQYVKAYFRLEKLTQAISDLMSQVEDKDSEIKNRLKELAEALEQSGERFRSNFHNYRNELERMRQKFVEKDDELRVARENLLALEAAAEHLQTTLPAKDVEFREMEKVLEGEIKVTESLVKRKEELLKGIPAREELNTEIGRLHARVVDLEAINLAESVKYIAKMEENVFYHATVDAEMTELKNDYARLESRLKGLSMRLIIMVLPDTSRSDLLRVIIAYFVEEVKRLRSERDTLYKALSDKGCICGAKIDRGNCLGVIETQLGHRTTELIEQEEVKRLRSERDTLYKALSDKGCICGAKIDRGNYLVKFIAKLEENVFYHAKVNAEMTELKNDYARLELRLKGLSTRFTIMVLPDTSRSDLLRVIVGYFVEEVKGLRSEQDTLYKALSEKGCICGAKIDRGNCLVKYIAKLEENVFYHAKVNAEMTELKNDYARLESCLKGLSTRFTIMVLPDTSRSDLLRVIVAYFVKEVKRLRSERDTLYKALPDKGCICGAKIDRGNCLGIIETQLGHRTAELIEQGRVVVAHKLKS